MSPVPKDLKPDQTAWIERGIFARGTKTLGVQYGISYTYKGRRYREMVGSSKTAAKHALDIRRGEIRQGRFNIPTRKAVVLFSDFAEEYIQLAKVEKRSWKRDEMCMVRFNSAFGKHPLDEITARDIEVYKMRRSQDTVRETGRRVTPRTVNLELALLKHMFNVAIIWKYLGKGMNPTDDVDFLEVRETPRRILSPEEQARLLAVAPPYLARIIVFAVNTGMRSGEIVNLKWTDVNLQADTVTVANTKSGRVRIIPINDDVRTVLRQCGFNRGDYVFGYKGSRILRFYRSWESALRQARIPRIRFHDLRHTAITRLVLAGTDLVTVQEIAGHKDLAMTQRYSHPTPESKRRAMDLLSSQYKSDTKVARDEILTPEGIGTEEQKSLELGEISGAPETTRTSDKRFRKPLLYPS
jgi:integrase